QPIRSNYAGPKIQSVSTLAQPPRGRNLQKTRGGAVFLEPGLVMLRCWIWLNFRTENSARQSKIRGMIFGTRVLLYSRDPEGARAFFRDVLGFPHVDAGGGWLVFRMPP